MCKTNESNFDIEYLLSIASHVEDKGMEEDFLDAEHIRLAAELIERFRKERNEARREVCNLMYQKGFPTGDYAKGRGWDCFKEDGK
jgi:hypothetical protein